MTVRVVVLLTAAEEKLLDWFITRRKIWSRTDAFRLALFEACVEQGMPMTDLPELEEQRKLHPPKRRIRHTFTDPREKQQKGGRKKKTA